MKIAQTKTIVEILNFALIVARKQGQKHKEGKKELQYLNGIQQVACLFH